MVVALFMEKKMKQSKMIEGIFQQFSSSLNPEQARELSRGLMNVLVATVAFQTKEQLAIARGMDMSVLDQESIHNQLATVSMDILKAMPEFAKNELILAMRSRDEVQVARILANELL